MFFKNINKNYSYADLLWLKVLKILLNHCGLTLILVSRCRKEYKICGAVVLHSSNPITQDAEARGPLWVWEESTEEI